MHDNGRVGRPPWAADPAERAVSSALAQILVGQDEPFEVALKRFNKLVMRDGILKEARRRAHYEKPSEMRKRKEDARLRKLRKKQRRADERARTGR